MDYFLSQDQLKSIINILYNSHTENEYYEKIQYLAKKNNVSPEFLLKTIRGYIISNIPEATKDYDKYYHVTSIESFIKIIDSGYLLSRKERLQKGEDLSYLGWSSSPKVQLSLNRIATQGPVAFVFGEKIYDEDTFYPSKVLYPTAEKVSINDACIAIIVIDEHYDEVSNILQQTNVANIPLFKASQWNQNISNAILEQARINTSLLNHQSSTNR